MSPSRILPVVGRPARLRSSVTCGSILLSCLAILLLAGVEARAQGIDEPLGSGGLRGTVVSRDVTAAAGESLADIARRELGRAGFAGPLADFNDLDPGATLIQGQLIRIPIHVPARGETATVVFVKGEASRNGTPLQLDDQIDAGDLLETGTDGFASFEFSTGSVVNLQPDTTLTLERLTCLENDDSCLIEIATERGDIGISVESRDRQPAEFRVTTPYSSAAVRGTIFDFAADPAAMRISVTEGEVETRALGISLPLEAGFGSITREGEPPGQPQPLLPAPVYRNVPSRVAEGDRVRWWQVSEATRYLLLVSTDSEGVQLVGEFDSPDDGLGFDGVPAGDYFLNLRGVDENGLAGFRSTTRLVIAEIDASLEAPAVIVERDDSDVLVRVEAPAPDAAGYEIQISSDEQFADPLGVDVGPTGQAVFRLDADTVHARARQLVTPGSVSAFGEATQAR